MRREALSLVAWGGIEPPTQGFSIHTFYYLPPLIEIGSININQQLTSDSLDKRTAPTLINIGLYSLNLPTDCLQILGMP